MSVATPLFPRPFAEGPRRERGALPPAARVGTGGPRGTRPGSGPGPAGGATWSPRSPSPGDTPGGPSAPPGDPSMPKAPRESFDILEEFKHFFLKKGLPARGLKPTWR